MRWYGQAAQWIDRHNAACPDAAYRAVADAAYREGGNNANSAARSAPNMADRSKYFKGGSFLKAADIKNGQTVTVEKFEEAKTRLGTRPVLRLVGIDEPFGLNATNFDKMVEKFGEDEKKWAGKRLRLVIVQAPNPSQGGKEGPAIRID